MLLDTRNQLLKYTFNTEITEINILRFISDWENEKLTPTLNSEKVPENNNGLVKIIVGENFYKVVMDESKDILVFLYSQYCNECLTSDKLFEELARKYQQRKNIEFAKIDMDNNEVLNINPEKMPVLRLYPKGNKSNPIDYTEGINSKELVEFLNKNLSEEAPRVDL